MKRYNYAIVGCGAAGKVHAYHFSREPMINCAVAIDANLDNAKGFKTLFGFRSCYSMLEDALANEPIDILSIATPPLFHADQITIAAKRKVDVLCEKPLFMNKYEAEETLNICDKMKIKLGVMLPRRFYNCSIATKEVLDRGSLGEIQRVSFDIECRKERSYYHGWRGQKKYAGGGVLMSQAIHSIDQLVFFFGKAVKAEGRAWRTREYIDIEDEAEGKIYFPNGVQAIIKATTNSNKYEWRGITDICGSKGRIVLDSENVMTWEVPGIVAPQCEENEDVPSNIKPGYYGPCHSKVIKNFVRSVINDERSYVHGKEALAALDIVWKINGDIV